LVFFFLRTLLGTLSIGASNLGILKRLLRGSITRLDLKCLLISLNALIESLEKEQRGSLATVSLMIRK
jgi:hypothetical protein